MGEMRGEDAHHLARVLRAQPGQVYEISDGQGAYLAEITEARPALVSFRVLEPVDSKTPSVRVTLCAALIKFDRFEWLVEKATELGVARIVPVETTRSEKGLFEAARKRMERWIRVARESSQQSRRLAVPEIAAPVRFETSLATAAGLRFFLEEGTAPPLWQLLPQERIPGAEAAFLLGPEGGWTDAERERAASAGWLAASLSPQVLRAETAAIAALAILVNAWMP
jgi:16S rRNA (uracil1498-N3)-methyltransferase